MFGMLDYRAHNLYWLITRPLVIISWIMSLGVIFASVAIAINYFDSWYAQLLSAVALLELLSLLLAVLLKAISWIGDKIFFFFIDVVPTGNRTKEQALAVLQMGEKNFNLLEKYLHPYEIEQGDVDEIYKTHSIFTRLILGDELLHHIYDLVESLRNYLNNHRLDNFEDRRDIWLDITNRELEKRSALFRFWLNPTIYYLLVKYVLFVAVFIGMKMK